MEVNTVLLAFIAGAFGLLLSIVGIRWFAAEALNVGAYDVLSKPFNRTEVIRIVSLAWLHWEERRDQGMSRYRPAESCTRPFQNPPVKVQYATAE
jgi:hypothetical protein